MASRLKATPSSPPGNSRSSFAITPGRPRTRAMPSPVCSTRPTSSRPTSGLKSFTWRRSASVISFGSNVSSAIRLPSSLLRHVLPCELKLATDAAVEDLIADPGDDTSDDAWIDDHPQRHSLARRLAERGRELLLSFLGQRDRGTHLSDGPLPPLGGELDDTFDDRSELTRAALLDQEREEVHRV